MKDLKQLQVVQDKIKNEIKILNSEIERMSIERKGKSQALTEIVNQINALIKEPQVSEHALVRYFERVLNVDLQEVKEAILPGKVIEMIRTLGDGEYPVGDFRILVKNNVVLTVLT